ncbi:MULTISPECIES: phosphoethanolamine transferase [Acinetobacter]|uniref:phosphoethanolamine transferase n=1 Tax=Acinetobacter TaxID=469 RepID=UPI001D173457|nr:MULTISPECIES: phosphoethanolamine transferase [Acinetobacter]
MIFRFKTGKLWFFIYCFMLLVPSLIISSDGFFKALYPLIFFVFLIYHYRRFFWLSLPIYLLTPFALYYEITYNAPTEISVWLTILGSSTTEGRVYLSTLDIPLAIGLIIAYIIPLAFFYHFIPNQRLNTPIWVRILALCLIFSPIQRYLKAPDHQQGFLNVYRHFKQSYPLNLVLGLPAASLEVNRVKDFIATQNEIECTQVKETRPTITVLVIGESARRDRLSLFGYTKNNTTPYLAKYKKDLWLFNNTISGSYMTSKSVPTLLTGKLNGTDNLSPSIVNAFNAAGYKTYWFSAQAQYGEYDSLVSAYASSAQETQFLTQHSYSASLETHYDEELLKSFDRALAEKKHHKFIVLHLYGSHADFTKRYPPQFNKFKDTYDNTVLYTDYLLNEVIQKLKATNLDANLIYTSDHGLNLGECKENSSLHLDMKNNFDVPLIMWSSNSWKQHHPEMASTLSKEQSNPISSINILPTVLDMRGIHCKNISQDRSLFNAKFKTYPREILATSETVNYDKGHDDSQCHLVS